MSIVSKTPDHLLEDDDVFYLRINNVQPTNMVMTPLMLLIGYGLKVLGRTKVDIAFFTCGQLIIKRLYHIVFQEIAFTKIQ